MTHLPCLILLPENGRGYSKRTVVVLRPSFAVLIMTTQYSVKIIKSPNFYKQRKK